MIAPLLIAISGLAKLGPAFAPLSSAEFQRQVLSVEESLEKGDFEAAKNDAALLPKRDVAVVWDDRKVPVEFRAEFRDSLETGLQSWGFLNAKPKASAGDIRIAFDAQLAPTPETGAPANVVTFFSDAPGEPRLTAIIGLKRGKDGRPATQRDIANDVRFVIGRYMGVTPHSLPAFSMFPNATEDATRPIGKPESRAAILNLQLSDTLRKAAIDKASVGISGTPKIEVDTTAFEGQAVQGEQVDLPIGVTNKGSGTVQIDAEGDCGCIVAEAAPPVEPGKTGSIKMRFETREYVGTVDRKVIVYTNDPEHPTVVIPVTIGIAARYRFLSPAGDTLFVEDKGRTADVYLTFPPEGAMAIKHLRVSGLEGAKATFTPWKGVLPDPDLKEGPKERNGFHIRLTLPGKLPTPRTQVSLAVVTDTPGFSILYKDLWAQKGIVAFPSELYLGELAKEKKSATILINRPEKPFAIKSVKATVPYLSAKFESTGKPNEYKILVSYEGTGPASVLNELVTVFTDDPKQPKIQIPVTGMIR